MSLTDFLEEPDVRDKFRSVFSKPKLQQKNLSLLVPPTSTNYSLIGTAFDYLLRFHIQYWRSQADRGHWVAQGALRRIQTSGNQNLLRYGKAVLERIHLFHQNFLATGDCNYEILASCLKLAQFDMVVRTDRVSPEIIRQETTKEDALELQQLIRIVPSDFYKEASVCFLNPTFGDASVMVGGADADLIVGDALIDIKTSKKLELNQRDFHQVIGYYTLHCIAGIRNDSTAHQVNRLGIYFSRYAYLYLVDVKDLVTDANFQSFLTWFIERTKKD